MVRVESHVTYLSALCNIEPETLKEALSLAKKRETEVKVTQQDVETEVDAEFEEAGEEQPAALDIQPDRPGRGARREQ